MRIILENEDSFRLIFPVGPRNFCKDGERGLLVSTGDRTVFSRENVQQYYMVVSTELLTNIVQYLHVYNRLD